MNYDHEHDASGDEALALEKMTYGKFYNTHVVRRAAQAPTKIDQWSTLQLPNNSIVHSVNGLENLIPKNNGLPDSTLPVIQNEKFPVYLSIQLDPSSETDRPLGVKENFIYRRSAVLSGVTNFFQKDRRIKRILSFKTIGHMSSVLTWLDYSPLLEMRVNGILGEYRKFDIIFRTILNTVSKIGNVSHHYILFPQNGNMFTRPAFTRTFRELSNSTLTPFIKDPSTFPLIQLLSWVYGMNTEVNPVPYKEDVRILGKEDPSFSTLRSTSLIERIDPELLANINFVFYKDDKAVIYCLADIVEFGKNPGFYQKLYRHIMNLRIDSSIVPDHIDTDSDNFEKLVNTLSSDKTPEDGDIIETSTSDTTTASTAKAERTPLPPAPVIKEVTPIVSVEHTIDSLHHEETGTKQTFESDIRKVVSEKIEKLPPVEQKTKTRHAVLLENHFKATIGGVSLAELIQDPPIRNVSPKTITSLKSTPEESYKKSSLLSLDKAYHHHAQKHELAKVISSLAKHGMYVTKIDEEHLTTEMDRTVTYKVGLTDLEGRSHQVKFTLPHVDEDGVMRLSGTEYRLTRQIANLPICKVMATRVNLSSNYNKLRVERVQSRRNSYELDIQKILMELKAEGRIRAVTGKSDLPSIPVPYDYSAIGRNFIELGIKGYTLHFDGNGAPLNSFNFEGQDTIKASEGKFGIPVGTGSSASVLFWDLGNQLHETNYEGKLLKSWASFSHFLNDVLEEDVFSGKTTSEWVQAKIINQNIPLIIILSYKFGLKNILERINLDYRFYPTGSKPVMGLNDISVRFADGYLVFNRYPLSRSLVAAGLNWVDLKDLNFRDLDVPGVYAKILEKKRMTPGVLIGLDGFFDFFVDPITETVLKKMKEPLTFPGLLLKASLMLSDYTAPETTAVAIHRFRLYERFNGIVYNEIYRALANYRKSATNRKAFSINPEAVFLSTVQDPTMTINDVPNPVHEYKQRTNFTFTGSGGRTSESLRTIKDRIYPEDGLGVISDAVPDSGKVGITAYLSASPRIDDIHGIPKPYKPGDTLSPPEVLSIGSMLMPGMTTDDGKRAAYGSIQLSHYVGNFDEGETLAVRTGYDEVLPHLVSDVFSKVAEDDGVVEAIDTKFKTIKVRYADQKVETIGSVKLPYFDTFINESRDKSSPLGFLVTEEDIGKYPVGGIFSLTKTTNGRVIDRIRCESAEAIPDKDVAKKQNSMVQDLVRGRHKALYYLRFTPTSIMSAGLVKSYSYADVHSPISGAYLLQKRTVNFKVGDKFKKDDILIYNPGFFVPDPQTKQVTFKHGVLANVAFIEKGSNLEDACEIYKGLSQRLKMTPCHQRQIITRNDAAILKIVKAGDRVETSDALCIISDEYLIQSTGYVEGENIDLMEKLNRQTPSAGYSGVVSKIRILYGGEKENLSQSLRDVLKIYEKETQDNFKALNYDVNISPPEKPGWVKPGTKYKGIDFTPETVVIEFMIEQTLDVLEGDKICISNAAKSIVSHVNEVQHTTESGVPIDILFSTTSIINRIINSPFMVGLAERNMDALKEKVIEMFDED